MNYVHTQQKEPVGLDYVIKHKLHKEKAKEMVKAKIQATPSWFLFRAPRLECDKCGKTYSAEWSGFHKKKCYKTKKKVITSPSAKPQKDQLNKSKREEQTRMWRQLQKSQDQEQGQMRLQKNILEEQTKLKEEKKEKNHEQNQEQEQNQEHTTRQEQNKVPEKNLEQDQIHEKNQEHEQNEDKENVCNQDQQSLKEKQEHEVMQEELNFSQQQQKEDITNEVQNRSKIQSKESLALQLGLTPDVFESLTLRELMTTLLQESGINPGIWSEIKSKYNLETILDDEIPDKKILTSLDGINKCNTQVEFTQDVEDNKKYIETIQRQLFDKEDDINISTKQQDKTREEETNIYNVEIIGNQSINKKDQQPAQKGFEEVCRLCMITSADLDAHMLLVHNVGLKPRTKNNLQHTPETQELLLCNDCGKQFRFRRILLKHMRKCKLNLKPTTKLRKTQQQKPDQLKHKDLKVPSFCNICNKYFTTNKNLKSHIKRIHGTQVLEQCELCSKQFRYKNLLFNHVLTVHENDSKECNICQKILKNKTALRKHKTYNHS